MYDHSSDNPGEAYDQWWQMVTGETPAASTGAPAVAPVPGTTAASSPGWSAMIG